MFVTREIPVQFCVVGGGMAGLCAAVAAARHGINTVLVHDRPVLGGNASSEIRMWICGAHGKDNREGGILEEIELENYYRNPANKYSIWDTVLYEKAMCEKNLHVLLNCSCLDAQMDGNTIKSITGWQLNTQTYYKITADYFADCSGDSVLAPLSGAEYMYGREGRDEYGESIAPEQADNKTMGMSCLMQIRETENPIPFVAPEWAYCYESDEELPEVVHNADDNFWWIELGGTGDCIHDVDKYREELLKIVYGVWDHMKNKGDHGVENWELEWIGFLPGKRESRRYRGAYVITQNDVASGGGFEDTVAYGGWSMDDHFPEGFYHRGSYPTIFHEAPSPWGICFRSLYSVNISNLLFAGRNISVTHTALSSSRVMATCALLGQAVGTAVSVMVDDGSKPSNIDIRKLQTILQYDDCYLPNIKVFVPELTLSAQCNADIVRSGIERGENNCWLGKKGDTITYWFDTSVSLNEIRIVFDSNFNRGYQNMPCNYKLNEPAYKLPDTLVKKYQIRITDENGVTTTIEKDNNRKRLCINSVNCKAVKVELIPLETWGCDRFHVFGVYIS